MTEYSFCSDGEGPCVNCVCACVSGDHYGGHQSSSGPGLCHSQEDAHPLPHQPACEWSTCPHQTRRPGGRAWVEPGLGPSLLSMGTSYQ